jgi:hypothetical protein
MVAPHLDVTVKTANRVVFYMIIEIHDVTIVDIFVNNTPNKMIGKYYF